MYDLKWDALDFLTVLEVEPIITDQGYSYLYIVEKDGLRLEVCVFPFEGDISILLFREGIEAPIVRLPLAECRTAKRILEKSDEFLEIYGVHSFSSLPYAERPLAFSVQVRIHPNIKVELV